MPSTSSPVTEGTTGRKPAGPADQETARIVAGLAKVDRIANLMDSRFRVPGIGVRIGWDGILGLIPGFGDVVTLGPSAYLVYQGWQLGAKKRTISKMAVNTGLDFVVGGVPILGDVFDMAFRANRRNADLLHADL